MVTTAKDVNASSMPEFYSERARLSHSLQFCIVLHSSDKFIILLHGFQRRECVAQTGSGMQNIRMIVELCPSLQQVLFHVYWTMSCIFSCNSCTLSMGCDGVQVDLSNHMLYMCNYVYICISSYKSVWHYLYFVVVGAHRDTPMHSLWSVVRFEVIHPPRRSAVRVARSCRRLCRSFCQSFRWLRLSPSS